jgi:hypothetical protein
MILEKRTRKIIPRTPKGVVIKWATSAAESKSMFMKAFISTAVEENRVISVEEMEARKKLGVGIGCVTLALCAAYPPYRSMYGLLGVGFS